MNNTQYRVRWEHLVRALPFLLIALAPMDAIAQASMSPRRAATAYRLSTPTPTKEAPAPSPPPSTPTPAWDREPRTFRNVPWGASEAEATARMATSEWKCGEVNKPSLLVQRACAGHFDVGLANVLTVFGFYDGKFVVATLTFESSNWTEVRDAFLEKFGPPSERSIDQLKTRMNVEYASEKLEWSGAAVIVQLSQYSGKVTESSGLIGLKSHVEEMVKTAKERKKKAAETF